MKYDRDGNPIRQNIKFEEPVQAAPVEQSNVLQTLAQPQEVEEPVEQMQPEVEATEEDENTQPVVEKPVRESHQAANFKIMKEKALAAEKRAQELEYALLAAQSKKQAAPQEEEEEEISEVSVDADALVEGKHLSKVNKHIKSLQNQLKQYQQQTLLSTTEVKLKAQYPDFDKIVSVENLESLRMTYPEIAQSINFNPDLYGKAVSAYTMIKKLGIGEEDPYLEEKAAIQRNVSKPKPTASIAPQRGESPLTKANAFSSGKLSDELKAQMLKEMNEYRTR